jgi:GTP-binding protein Era
MQEVMNAFVNTTFEDADLMIFVTTVEEQYDPEDPLFERLRAIEAPLFLIINKTDLVEPARVLELIQWWRERLDFKEIIPTAALHKSNTDTLLEQILRYLPEGPVYYPKDQLTDRPERFFVSEIIREKILELYHQEVPYSVEVIVQSFKETETKSGDPLIRIGAEIFVARQSQKAIIIGKGGTAIKRLGTVARKSLETWLEQKVFLELHVKVKDNWRDDDRLLKHFGYQ